MSGKAPPPWRAPLATNATARYGTWHHLLVWEVSDLAAWLNARNEA